MMKTKRTGAFKGEADGTSSASNTEVQLAHGEVRALAMRYHLPNKFIYEIFSEFMAMRELLVKQGFFARMDLELPAPIGEREKRVWRLGVPLSCLRRSSPFFLSKHPLFISRLLSALGKRII